MNLCIIGSGIAGLSAAFYLTEGLGVNVEVFEKASVLGGRANVTNEGEHCPRLFLSDYERFFGILSRLPADPDGGTISIHDGLRSLRRFYFTESAGWIELSHLYGFFAREIPMRDRIRAVIARRRAPLVAEEAGPNTNRLGSRKNFSFRTLVKLSLNLLKSRTAFAFDGPTDCLLIEPWVRYLEGRGVRLHTETPVVSLVADGEGVTVETSDGPRRFDAVLVAAFLPDAIALLEASGANHSLRQLDHIHCVCFTVGLNEREPILDRDGPAVYCREGLNILVQPLARRCLVLCTNSASTDPAWVEARTREILDLEQPIIELKRRENRRLDEAVYCADYVHRDAIVPGGIPGVYFAGSYVDNSYPLDSAEGATRTAWDAVEQIRREHDIGPEATELQLAEA